MTILKGFNTGWINSFENRLSYLKELFPDLRFNSVERYNAMLRINASVANPQSQQVVDDVLFRIERQSARICELCGKHGKRILNDPAFKEPLCLCTMCYAVELDKLLNTPLTNQD